MTLLEINLTDVLLETDPDDKVVVWAPVLREGPAGQLVGTRRKEIPLTDGVGSDEVVPGPLMVQVQCKAMRDMRPREVVVPETGPVTLADLLDSVGAFTYAPPVVGQVAQMRDDAEAARDVSMEAAAAAVAGAADVAGAEATITEARDQAVTAVEDTRDSVVADVNLAGSTATTEIAGQVTAAEGHATQTADDRRQTGEDRTQTGLDRQAAAQSATDAATSATAAEGHKTTVQTALAGARLYSGTGFPNGVVAAPVGSIYTDTAATAGAVRWIKTSGTGNTGWQVEYGDTGWRALSTWDVAGTVTGFPLAVSWAPGAGVGGIYIRRIENTVHLRVENLHRVSVDAPAVWPTEFRVGGGFYPEKQATIFGLLTATSFAVIMVETNGQLVRPYGALAGVNGIHTMSGVYLTSQPWPTSLPGTPT